MAINFLQSTKLPDDVKLQFGDSTDFEIYHDATTNQNKITSLLGRQLLINSASVVINNAADTQNMIIATDGGAVSLYCAGSLKLATTSVGSTITGGLTTTASSSLAGANMSAGIAMGTNAITGMADPSSAQDAATKAYVDSQISGVPQGTVTGTGVDNRLAIWNGTTAIDSDSDFRVDGNTIFTTNLEASGSITWSGGSSSESNSAYDNMITAFSDSGSSTITLTLTQQDGGTLTTAFSNPQGTVTGVTGTAPVVSSGGTTPAISMAAATGSVNGYLTSSDWTTFNNKGSGSMSSWLLTGDSGGSATIDNGETVDIAGGTNITTARSGNTVTINTSATTNTGTVQSVGLSTGGDAFQITGTPVTTSGTLAISFQGDTEEYINGEGDLTTFPTIPSAANNSTITINTGTGLSGGGSFTLNQAGNTTLNLAATNNGTVTSVATSSPITGGTITGSGTIGLDQTAITALGNLAETGTVTGGVWNSNTRLDKTSTTDGDYQGELVYLGGTTVVKGKLYVYSGGDWISADADAESTSKGLLAMAVSNGNSGTVGMLTRGMYTLPYDPGTDGDILYISTTAGNVDYEPPSGSQKVVRIVGTLLDSTNGQMFFHPDNTYITLS
jgi:hypothetical protein